MAEGTLVLVATPIGNLGDLSPRAVRTLSEAGVIACEDTRRTRKLLTHAGISAKQLIAVHDHNEALRTEAILELLARGVTVAVVTDAGMPSVSDPGARLAAAAAGRGATVTVVPGPSAALAALAVSGLATGRFCFEGFLPRRGEQRVARLEAVAAEERTTVLYEAPHRLAATLHDLEAACGGERAVVVARELTKLHEEVWRGSLSDAAHKAAEEAPRGEHVLVLAGAPAGEAPALVEIEAALSAELAAGRARRDAVAAVAAGFGVPRRQVYETALKLKAEQD